MSQDFHLAKRFYDQAAEIDNKARAPRDIALVMLEVSSSPPPHLHVVIAVALY